MDLGCMDLGCVDFGCMDEKNTKNSCSNDETKSVGSSDSSSSSGSKHGKNKSPRGSPPLNRVTSQIKKPLHRKTSPLNWFPRQKVDSYLKRKIKLLQEAGGMNDTLDETLGDANPHYCRVLREKMAAREAARKVMEARKAAMVEASWCRILQAARIPSKEADALLLKAEKEVTEALEAATAKGVIMYDTPEHPRRHFEIETSSVSVRGSTHTVKASFETGFAVDKQVAAAVKTAFIRLAHCSSFNKDEFKDLLRKISENPDTRELSESDTGSEVEVVPPDDRSNSERKNRKKLSPQKYTGAKLVNMMLQRLKCLNEEELASLATIVATCGLNAALAETESHNRAREKVATSSMEYFMNGTVKPKQAEPELPSLDKFLIKKMTKLEKEVQEAKNARKAESNRFCNGSDSQPCNRNLDNKPVSTDVEVPDLGSVLVKHSSKLEKEIEEAKKNKTSVDMDGLNSGRTLKHSRSRQLQQEDTEVPSLDKFLVKHVTRLEREVQEAKSRRKDGHHITSSVFSSGEEKREKENVDLNRRLPLEIEQNDKANEDGNMEKESSLDRLEKEKMQASQAKESGNLRYNKLREKTDTTPCESLDKYLVKHVSRLEKEKLGLATKQVLEIKKRDATTQVDTTIGGLDQILVKRQSRLEREKDVASQKSEDGNKYSLSRREARDKELLETWGGIGLGDSMRPHVSRLQQEQKPEDGGKYSLCRREARDKELLETWGGIGLGNSMRPHVSRIERDKAAWLKAEENERALEDQ